MAVREVKVGDWVVYAKGKHSESPGPRAQDITAASKGDDYHYTVEKYWLVTEVRADGTLLLRTRRGKQHEIEAGDIRLRHATLWERWRHRHRFPPRDES